MAWLRKMSGRLNRLVGNACYAPTPICACAPVLMPRRVNAWQMQVPSKSWAATAFRHAGRWLRSNRNCRYSPRVLFQRKRSRSESLYSG